MPINTNQFLQTFVDESMELLQESEKTLLSIDIQSVNSENINHLFRAMHSIKGTSAIFNFTSINLFANTLESFLGQVRSNTRILTKADIDLLLKSVDCIRTAIVNIKNKNPINNGELSELSTIFNEKMVGMPHAASDKIGSLEKPIERKTQKFGWDITFTPSRNSFQCGTEPSRLFKQLSEIGKLSIQAGIDQLPEFHQLDPTECHLNWHLKLYTDAPQKEVENIIYWVEDKENVCITPICTEEKESPIIEKKSTVENKTTQKNAAQTTSIRIETKKIDSLINITGELIINQSKLNQITKNFNGTPLTDIYETLDLLETHSKELQEKVMRIRMVPIEFLFNRFQRLAHDLSKDLGKEVNLIIAGEQTELDKNMIEMLSDPILHLMRNALDHGIELPAAREKAKKPSVATIWLNAYQKGSHIIIEMIDDGAGLNKEKILSKAISAGLLKENQGLSDDEIYKFIFQPGFSTAERISDISGRGVGLDVVYKNITALGGKIEVQSKMGIGTTFRLCLPLTLAIMECQLIKISGQIYIIPLMNILEITKLDIKQFNKINDRTRLYHFREQYIPIVFLQEIFSIPNFSVDIEKKLLIIMEVNNQLIGLVVDELLSQQQIVIKNIEENYEKIPGIAGVTILDDGKAALILDINAILDFASNPQLINNKPEFSEKN